MTVPRVQLTSPVPPTAGLRVGAVLPETKVVFAGVVSLMLTPAMRSSVAEKSVQSPLIELSVRMPARPGPAMDASTMGPPKGLIQPPPVSYSILKLLPLAMTRKP